MDERLRFVARLLEGESMTDACRQFGISRKTGYKIFTRYQQHGVAALSDRVRRPVRYANQLPAQIETLIVALKRDKPHWGARKIRELLVRRLDGDLRIPAKSTIHAVLHRHGLVKPMRRPRSRATGTPCQPAWHPMSCGVPTSRRVQARQWPLLLSADGHGPRFALPAAVRGARVDARGHGYHRFRAAVSRARSARGDSLRQRGAFCQPECAVQSVQARGLVAAPGHRHRAHPARPAAAAMSVCT